MDVQKGKITLPEIGGQAEAIAAAWTRLQGQKDWVSAYIGNESFDEIIFIGSGSSYYQAMIMAVSTRLWLGRRSVALPSSDILLLRKQSVAGAGRILLVGVSRSGESSEVIMALESVKELEGWTTCGITCYPSSRLGTMTKCLVSPLGQEASTVMTKSFSSMTFMMQAAIALVAGAGYLGQMETVKELAADIVQRSGTFAAKLAEENRFDKFIYLGMGAYYGVTQEACLKLKEMAYVWTESYGTLEFRHGPKSIVEPGTLVCLLVSEQTRAYELKVAEEMKGYGASILLLTAAKGGDTAFADEVFEIGAALLSDEARAVLYLPLLQYIGFYFALKCGVDPDHPRNLTQVVTI
ncbi:SIS domain-containing protein [Paenibacillus sp. PAMC21692]|uniref:SIS domain-containing protein n=1 Tax=Paenibacillus sp. PAMC21692 TaxID=2762320 RepID=UPI0037CA8665